MVVVDIDIGDEKKMVVMKKMDSIMVEMKVDAVDVKHGNRCVLVLTVRFPAQDVVVLVFVDRFVQFPPLLLLKDPTYFLSLLLRSRRVQAIVRCFLEINRHRGLDDACLLL